jgi:hypothetical protein
MDYSDNSYQEPKNKNELIVQLLEAAEQANSAYLGSRIEREEWAEQLKDIDAKLRVVGIALTNRPWSGGSGGTF